MKEKQLGYLAESTKDFKKMNMNMKDFRSMKDDEEYGSKWMKDKEDDDTTWMTDNNTFFFCKMNDVKYYYYKYCIF